MAGLGQCNGRSRSVTSTTGSALASACAIVDRSWMGVDGRQPRLVLGISSVDDVEKHRLQFLRHRPALARAYRSVVQFPNWGHLGCSAGEEGLIRNVELIACDPPLQHGDAQLFGERDNRAAGDAVERAAGEVGGM